jgi:hypothetical protein
MLISFEAERLSGAGMWRLRIWPGPLRVFVFLRGDGVERDRSGEEVVREVGEAERVELDERDGVEGWDGMSVVSSAVEALV